MDLGLQNRVALVTASSKGLGKATALQLAQEGAKIVICARGQDALDKSRDEIATLGAEILALPADLTAPDAAQTLVNATLDRFGAVSEEVAREMAEGALANSRAQLAVSVTGIAGPGGSEFKPEGRVCFGLAMQDRVTDSETQEFGPRGREWVRLAARDHALFLLLSALR